MKFHAQRHGHPNAVIFTTQEFEGEWWHEVATWDICRCSQFPVHEALPGSGIALVCRGMHHRWDDTLGFMKNVKKALLWGYCDALTPPLEPGVLVWATEIITDKLWMAHPYTLAVPTPTDMQRPVSVYYAPFLGSHVVNLKPKDKHAIHRKSGAWVVDREAADWAEAVSLRSSHIQLSVLKMVLRGPNEGVCNNVEFIRKRHDTLRQRYDTRTKELLSAVLLTISG